MVTTDRGADREVADCNCEKPHAVQLQASPNLEKKKQFAVLEIVKVLGLHLQDSPKNK